MTPEDDAQRLTSRRGFLATAALGATGLAVASTARSADAATSTLSRLGSVAEAKTCLTMTPTEEVGPFYVAYNHVRSNIRGGQSGLHLRLHVKVINVKTCKPVPNAALDIWHANALGVYSAESSENTVGKTFCRGIQITDSHGRVTFKTIMPGWYEGRVNHIHAKVRFDGTDSDDVYTGGTTDHIGQMFFPQKVNDAVAKLSPYTNNKQGRITNATDRVYTQQGGDQCVIKLTGNTSDGYVGHLTIGIKP